MSSEPADPSGGGVRFSLRLKLLVALVGTVALLLGATQVVLRQETGRQVDRVVERTALGAQDAFREVERLRQRQIEELARRYAGTPRMPAMLDAAIEADDPRELAEDALYELQLAGMPDIFAGFTDAAGQPFLSLVAGRALASEPADGPQPLVLRLLESPTGEPVHGYRRVEGDLYKVHVVPVVSFGWLIGTLTLGFPVDDEFAASLAGVDAEWCFVTAGECVAATPGVRASDLRGQLAAMAGEGVPRRAEWSGRHWGVASTTLADEADAPRLVLAVPLDAVLAPFQRIQRAQQTAGLLAIGVALLLGLGLAHGLTTPVRALVAATERVRRGDYEVRIRARSRDEIGVLAAAFNQMTEGLLLKERYRGALDKVLSPEIAEEVLKSDLRLGGETREVTILFADLRGFTPLTQGMQPADVLGMLNEWFDLASAAVEQEGGVVDKYIGDAVMAIFGAPIAQPDHAARGVRAALRMRAALETLNRERTRRGEPALQVGTGLNTGAVVAGNTGSARRLNYTVLGDAVNLAARIAAAAGPGEVLVSETTRLAAGERVRVDRIDDYGLKGLSQPVRVYAVAGMEGAGAPATAAGAVAILVAAAAATVFAAPPASAQLLPDPPTLAERGVFYTSPGGFLQIVPAGRIDLEGFLPQDEPAGLIRETEPFLAGRASLFLDAFAGERVFASAELRADRGRPTAAGPLAARVEQAFVRVRATSGNALHIQAGTFVTPFGAYAQRHAARSEAFIRPPLHHEYRTVLSSGSLPESESDLLRWKNSEARRAAGQPVIWNLPYPTGAMAMGIYRRISYRAALVNSAPSSDPSEWGPGVRLRPNPVAHLGIEVGPALRIGASYATAPWLRGVARDGLPPGARLDDHHQELLGLDLSFTRGLFEGHAELVQDRWSVPNVSWNPRDRSYFVEAKLKHPSGGYIAVRHGALSFSRHAAADDPAVERQPWDHPVRRTQFGGGFRIARNLGGRVEYAHTRTAGPRNPRDDLAVAQLWWTF